MSGDIGRTYRVRYPPHYRSNDPKVNVILAVETGSDNVASNLDRSINRPRRWVRLCQENVGQFVFGGFINKIIYDIENHPVPDNYDDTHIFIWKNLRDHKIPCVTTIIEDRTSQNIFSSIDYYPYCPKIDPIEYFFVN